VTLLQVDQLRVTLQTARGPADALRGVSFSLDRGQTLGLIGESGSGKSITALALIADGDMPERQQCLDDFARRWQGEALVMDKWFMIQAMASRADTVERVRGLMEHPGFSIRNPNKVYALVGGFTGNPVRFNAADGSGYAFLADTVLTLDRLNPQVASRMAKAFARWRKYDDARQAHARAALERIVGTSGLSSDVYEIASKSLAG